MPKPKTLYDTIRCKPSTPKADLRRAVHRLLLHIHPDKNTGAPPAETAKLNCRVNCVTTIRDILLNDDRRSSYNRLLRAGVLPPHGDVDTDFEQLLGMIDANRHTREQAEEGDE
jgi:curved DNA-binding protein CbpA